MTDTRPLTAFDVLCDLRDLRKAAEAIAAGRPVPRQRTHDALQEARDTVSITDPAAYADRALEETLRELANTGEGGRNDQLNRAAFSLGRLVGAEPEPLLDEQTVTDGLQQASLDNGYLAEEGPASVERTIERAMHDGMAQPLIYNHTPAPNYPPPTPFVPVDPATGEPFVLPDPTPASVHQQAVDREVSRLRVLDDAARIVKQERAGARTEPPFTRLDNFLAVHDDPVAYRIEGLWPIGGRVVLAAQYKSGKTTLRNNLARALADNEPFLDRFPVAAPTGPIVIIDNELDEGMLRRWLREVGIRNTSRVHVLPLRGNVACFDILDPTTRARWASRLRELDTSVVLFDCLRPVLDALGLSEDKEAGRFLVAFDALLLEANVGEAVVVHHMGHNGERSRGDTRLRDWPDVEWRLVRETNDTGAQDPNARVYFSAYGRDVDTPEGLLGYDVDTRRVHLVGGNRRDTAGEALVPDVVSYLQGNPGATGRGITAALHAAGHARAGITAAVAAAVRQGLVDTTQGARNATLHFLTPPTTPSVPTVP